MSESFDAEVKERMALLKRDLEDALNRECATFPEEPMTADPKLTHRAYGIGILLQEGGLYPPWYGGAWRQRRYPYRLVCFHIPLNILLGVPYAIWRFSKRPWGV